MPKVKTQASKAFELGPNLAHLVALRALGLKRLAQRGKLLNFAKMKPAEVVPYRRIVGALARPASR